MNCPCCGERGRIVIETIERKDRWHLAFFRHTNPLEHCPMNFTLRSDGGSERQLERRYRWGLSQLKGI